MKDSIQPTRESCQGGRPPLSDLEVSNEIDGAVAEIIDAFEQARLVRTNHPDAVVQRSMDHIRASLTVALRHLAPFAFHAERWLGEEVEKWPGNEKVRK